MGIAVGRRIDQKEQTFSICGGGIDVVAILGADIGGRASRHGALLKNSLKFRTVII